MIRYASGEESLPGDRLDFDGTPGVVEAVLGTPAEWERWGLEEPGLMIKAEPYGLVFQPVAMCDWTEVVLLGRADEHSP
jgi:hypothetical protein